jgi:hypothetical protein
MKKKEKQLRFTIEERIVLHLIDFSKFQKEIEAPLDITQQGIASAVGIHRKHLPRSLRALRDKGFITEKPCHVPGKPQRIKAYFLTSKGEDYAWKLKNHLFNTVITIREKNGVTRITTLGEVQEINGQTYRLAEILSLISPEGFFDVDQVEQKTKQKLQQKVGSRLVIYKKALAQAWKDGKMTRDERQLLQILRGSLNITETEHMKLEEELLNEVEKTGDLKIKEVYKVALEQALMDQKISDDERAILERIRNRFNIKDEEY